MSEYSKDYDNDGNVVGYHAECSDGLGGTQTVHYNTNWEKTGTSEVRSDGCDNYVQHYDSSGQRCGTSQVKDSGTAWQETVHRNNSGERTGSSYVSNSGTSFQKTVHTDKNGNIIKSSSNYNENFDGGSSFGLSSGTSSASSTSSNDGDDTWVGIMVLVGVFSVSILVYEIITRITTFLRKSAHIHHTSVAREFWMHILAFLFGMCITSIWIFGIPFALAHYFKDSLNVDLKESTVVMIIFISTMIIQLAFLLLGPSGVFLRQLFYHSIR